jgi:hypothetical protein
VAAYVPTCSLASDSCFDVSFLVDTTASMSEDLGLVGLELRAAGRRGQPREEGPATCPDLRQ